MDVLQRYVSAEYLASIDAHVEDTEQGREVKLLSDLVTPVEGDDPNELIKHRFLYRGGTGLLCGPTGIGKSSFGMQLAIHLAGGIELFGIEPGESFREAGMQVLHVQAENDEGDLAQMRDGVLLGDEDLTQEHRDRALRNIKICTICDRTSDNFAQELDSLIQAHGPFDIVMIDPAFAYLGGDSNSQKDVSHFMRELMNPLAQKHQVGLIITHHTNKPLRGREKDNWAAGDYSYLGAGSAEWINPCRAALAIRSLGSESVFELRAPKRGKKLNWVDSNGNYTTVQYIAHHEEPGIICWRRARPEEVEELLEKKTSGRPKGYEMLDVLTFLGEDQGKNQAHYKKHLSDMIGCSPNTIQNALAEGVKLRLISCEKKGSSNIYELTATGRDAVAKSKLGAGDGPITKNVDFSVSGGCM